MSKSVASLELIKISLLNSELCAHFEPNCINLIADKMHLEEYLQGDLIMQQGSPGEKLCVVECKLSKCFLN